MRKPLIAGNWKMYHTPSQGGAMIKELLPMLANIKDKDIVICPPFTDICLLSNLLKETKTNLALGAQNMHHLPEGAYTGEVSADMLLDLAVEYVILGHSERREYFGETDQTVSQKGQTAVGKGLIPIVCVGESQTQREAGQTLAWIKGQILDSLAFWDGQAKIVVAYEPIWAIGTGLTATGQDAEGVIAFIRSTMAEKWGQAAEQVQILYGGSVKPESIAALMQQPNIDGALVGGASLKAASFAAIVANF